MNRIETSPSDLSATVELPALRPNAETAAGEWRRTVPVLLAGIVAEVPEAELVFEMFTDADGMVATRLTVSAGEHSTELASELAAVLAPVAESTLRPASSPVAAEWPLVVDAAGSKLGFASESSDGGSCAMPWRPAGELPGRELIEELATMPGHGLHVSVRALDSTGQPRWDVRLRALTGGSKPSLRFRAELRRRFPGLKVAETRDGSPVRLQIRSADLPAVFAIPIAGTEPLAGAHMAAPAPIPATPNRSSSCDGESTVRLGHAFTGGGRAIDVALHDSERFRHVHVLGQTGTGKSSVLAAIAHAVAQRAEGALVVDPHGQLCDRILAELPDEARDRVWVIRCGDVENSVPLNPLAETDSLRRDIAIADICGTFQYLFDKKETGIVGPRFVERVAMTLRALAAVHGTRASLLDVPIASADEGFMATAVATSSDDRLKAWWRTNQMEKNSNEHGQVLAWVNSKFEAFSNTAATRAILGSGANAIDFADAMDGGRIILLDLSKAELGEQASRLLGFLYLGRVWEAALRRTRRDRPFTVIVDEAHTLISGALTNMLAEGRKFGLGVVIAHQYLEQLDEDLRPATAGNVATTIAFRCAVADAAEIGRRFGGRVEPSTLVTLPDLSAVALRSAMSGPSYPHTLMIDHNDRVLSRRGDALVGHTQLLMAQTRADLVDPYRELTAISAEGVSNVKSIAVERLPDAKPARRPAGAKAAPPPAPRPAPPGGSFLDDWIAKRAKLAESDYPAPARGEEEGGADELDAVGA